MLHSIENGATLSEACQNQPASFSPVNCQLIRAGELSGQLPEVLQAMVHSLKWQDEILSKTRKLLIYPCFILFVILAVAFFLLTHLLPQLAGFLQGMAGAQALPMQTRALMALSALLTEHGWLLLSIPVVSALLLAALYQHLPGMRQRLHRMLLQLPYLGSLLRKSILARLANNFALLYRSGIPVLDTLGCCQQLSANLEIQHTMARVRERIAQGAAISSSFAAEKIFPALFIRMLKVGESTGELDRALNNIDYFYSRDMEESIARMQAMIEPSMSIIMALLLGSIMLSVFGPLYDSISAISF